MAEETRSIEQRSFRINVGMLGTVTVFLIATVFAAGVWAQNVTNHLANVDFSLMEMKDVLKKVQDFNVLQERTLRMEVRLQHLEEWQLAEARSGR